jgi:peptidyl-prolyl cis-trans isomerase D
MAPFFVVTPQVHGGKVQKMLQSMREGVRSPWVLVVIGLIVLSFVLTGAESLTFGGGQSGAAKVNDREISYNELQFAIEQQRRQLTELYADQIDPSLLDDDLLRPGVLNSLIDRALLEDFVASLGIAASPRAVRRNIVSNEAFELDGAFSADYYRDVLRTNGVTPDQFRQQQSNADQLVKLESAISEAAFVTPTEANAAINVVVERRDVLFLVVPAASLNAGKALAEEDIDAFYQANIDRYAQPERVVAEFIELTPDQFLRPLDESEVAAQLEDALADFDTTAQSEVAHILLIQNPGETDQNYASRIEAVTAQLNSGADFSSIARDLSDDIGSSSVGGDLGFTDGSVFPDEMEAAIAELSIGQVSPAVKTDSGTHFILLKSRSAAQQVSEDVLRAEITDSLQTAQTQRDLLIAVDRLREEVFSSDGLSDVSLETEFALQTSTPFSRESGDGLFQEAALRAAAFSDDVLIDGNNSEVIELSGSRFVALAITERLPEGTIPLDEVRADIIAELEAQAEAAALQTLVADVNLALSEGQTLESISESKGLEWRVELAATRRNVNLPQPVLQEAFLKPASETNNVTYTRLSADEYALVQLARTQAGKGDTMVSAERDALLSEVLNVQSSLLRSELIADLKRRGDVVIR